MGLIGAIKAGLDEILASTVSKVAADEVKAWTPWIASRLTTFAVRRLPEHCRDRYREEWASHLEDIPGNVGKLWVAIGFYTAARKIAAADPDSVPAYIWLIRFLLVLTFPFLKGMHVLMDRIINVVNKDPKWARFTFVRRQLIYPLISIGVLLVSVLLSIVEQLFKIPKVLPRDIS